MKTIESKLPFNYKTIRITQSRIDKGLLAIPVSIIDYFPKDKTKVYVAMGIDEPLPKRFTPYTSTSRECRIGGMRGFYEKFAVKDGDEVVLQFLDTNTCRIFTEQQFEYLIREAEDNFDGARSETEAEENLGNISKIANTKPEETLWSEFYRLSKIEVSKRRHKILKLGKIKEGVSPSTRKLLIEIYEGKCQISGFGFLMKNGKPYFEIHHIKPALGEHIKNVLVVSPNIHAQFTYAVVNEYFDGDGWLRRVKFNDQEFLVSHIIDKIPKRFEKEIHYELER
jgi:hypothetical protein